MSGDITCPQVLNCYSLKAGPTSKVTVKVIRSIIILGIIKQNMRKGTNVGPSDKKCHNTISKPLDININALFYIF